MIVVLIGAPGAGKGTQADLLVERRKYRKLSTGDALRRQIKDQTPVGKKVEPILARGELVSDDVLLEIVDAELAVAGSATTLFDGYPRNLGQAKSLEKIATRHPVGAVVHLDVNRPQLIARLAGRRVCPECGATFHMQSKAPRVAGKCDRCGSGLVTRPDDEESKIVRRLEVFDNETQPVLDFYRKHPNYQHVDGLGSTEEVYERIARTLEKAGA